MGGVHLHVRTSAPPFPYLGNRWAHYAEIWYVVRYLVTMRFMQVIGRVLLHVMYLKIRLTNCAKI